MLSTSLLRRLSFYLLPGSCILCGSESRRHMDLCEPCEHELPWITHACRYCSLPIPAGPDICGDCILEKPDFSAAICAFEYAFPVDHLINRFKESAHLASGAVLAECLAARYAELLHQLNDAHTVIAPVPLHWRKQRSRGFNQAAIIAATIASSTRGVVDNRLIRRQHATSDQKQLGAKERHNALKDVFACQDSRALIGKRVILVDDVITTTATANEAARSLLKNGADDVVVFALARTPRQH